MLPPDAGGFHAAFERAPTFVVRAPGRVNLIGEHIDYLDLSVLPMTLDRGITLTCAARSDAMVRLRDTDGAREGIELGLDRLPARYPGGHWGNYVVAALRAAHGLGAHAGFDAVVDADLPAAAGLSSSSALVVAVALAALTAADIETPAPAALADLLARAERGTGTRGGHMDQTVILAGSPGGPLLVTRRPAAVRPLPLPPDWSFVVAHSLEIAEKSGGAQEAYNARRRDAEKAIERVAEQLSAPETGLADLIDQFGTARLLREARLLAEAERLSPRAARRLRHAVTENDRVTQAVEALRAADRERFGHLMLESHASLRDDYEVSTRSLDRLVELAVESGADGARLTGAGLGGCVVALVHTDAAQELIGGLERTFFSHARPNAVVEPARPVALESVRFAAMPGPPAGVARLPPTGSER